MVLFDFKTTSRELKNFVISATAIVLVQMILSSLFTLTGFIVGGAVLMAGALAYCVIVFYAASLLVNKSFRSERLRFRAEVLLKGLTALVLFVLVLQLLNLKILVNSASLHDRFSGFFGVLVIIFSTVFLRRAGVFVKRLMRYKLVLFLFFLFSFPVVFGSGLNDTVNVVRSVDSVLTVFQNLTSVGEFLWNQQALISESLGLTPVQSLVVWGIIILLAVLFAAKFLETIAKWLIIVLVGVLVLLLIT